MARQLRIEYPDAVYHSIGREGARSDIYILEDQAVFLEFLSEDHEIMHVTVYCYRLMDNHYHCKDGDSRGHYHGSQAGRHHQRQVCCSLSAQDEPGGRQKNGRRLSSQPRSGFTFVPDQSSPEQWVGTG
ncbi:hypothetical protein JW905_00045 [bacterium]|nr:hypothetical protein [candidate division CSSED10-310 bacterium]